jgi:hypothetical protein
LLQGHIPVLAGLDDVAVIRVVSDVLRGLRLFVVKASMGAT